MTLKIAILEADHVADHLVREFGTYPDMFQNLLWQVAADISFDVFTVVDGQFPTDLKAYDGFLITGSRYSAYDDEPWIQQLMDLIKALYKMSKPLVGICFGHQLIAHALGGITEKAQQGWGVGAQSARVYYRPRWMQHLAKNNQFTLLVSHQDQVVTLPKNAALLAGSHFCPNGMFQLGETILTFQGHPEFTKGYSRGLMEMRREALGEETYQKGVDSLQQGVDSNLVAHWIVEFIEANRHS